MNYNNYSVYFSKIELSSINLFFEYKEYQVENESYSEFILDKYYIEVK